MSSWQRIGVVVPTAHELAPLLAALNASAVAPAGGIWPRWQAMLGIITIILTTSGPGLVNAAAATEALIIHDAPDLLALGGIAGAHHPDARPGDLLIPDRICAPFNARLLPGGVLDPIYGIRWDGEVTAAWGASTAMRTDALTLHPDIVATAVQAATNWIADCQALAIAAAGEAERTARVWVGMLASADTWTRDPGTIAWMRTRFGSLGEDMESVALAQIAARHTIPCCIVRCLSNNDLIETLTEDRQRQIFPLMAERAAGVLAATLRAL